VAAAINQKWRKMGSPGVEITASDLAGLWLDAKGRCSYCGIDIELMTASFDHVTPFGRGGPNTVENLAACCMTCQRVKFTKMPEELAEYRALKRICRAADCNVRFQPRYADYVRGFGFYHSRSCAAKAASH
jgi:5-methylcytosine-specific restriction endonuclease McrA